MLDTDCTQFEFKHHNVTELAGRTVHNSFCGVTLVKNVSFVTFLKMKDV